MRVSHSDLQDKLTQLGDQFGFHAFKEYYVKNLYPTYSPRIDVTWFYPLSIEQTTAIKRVYDLWPYWHEGKALYPYAAFEITVSDATSKIVLSEMWNMRVSGFRYSFKIVPNKDTKHSDRMHKERAERIDRTIRVFSGVSDTFILSREELLKGIRKLSNIEKVKNELYESNLIFKTPNLRKNLHNDLLEFLAKLGEDGGFIPVLEYRPPWLKKLKWNITMIRHDAVWLLKIPEKTKEGFIRFLNALGIEKIFRSVTPVEVLAFEVELKHLNKHSLGSILNIANVTGRGTIITKKVTKELIETVRLISSNKVDIKSLKELYAPHEA